MELTHQEIDLVRETARNINALVIGDAMLDQYIFGHVHRMSPEAPVPILTHQHTETKAGGAANVALNLAAWGCRTSLLAITGTDDNGRILETVLNEYGIKSHLIRSPSRPTTVKTRVVSASHHLLRIDQESDRDLNAEESRQVILLLTDVIRAEKPELIILQDYNKGLLTPEVIRAAMQEAKNCGAFVAVDPKEKNFFAYRGADLFKPNLREAEHAARQPLSPEDLSVVCRKWTEEMEVSVMAVTLGGHGIFLQNTVESHHSLPHKTIDVVDVCGAGDAVICALALGVLAGLSLASCGALGNATGGYVCSHSGVVSIDTQYLYHWI